MKRVLLVRLGAMGDVLHALPVAASLRRSFPGARLAWAVEPRWRVLVEAAAGEIIEVDRRTMRGLRRAWRELHAAPFDCALDVQGLFKSALVAAASGAPRIVGFDRAFAREGAAAVFYTERVAVRSAHVVERNLELAAAAGVTELVREFPLPAGAAEGDLPAEPFVLASPLAGWVSKQWPLENYAAVARGLRVPLVLNVAPADRERAAAVEGVRVHVSSIAGLIDATRRAAAVIGLDSGPLHLAAALGKRGVALFGPTDPARNGPYGGTITVLRAPDAVTSYRRESVIAPSLRALAPEQVLAALPREVVA
jgi:heptosyltransferase-1